MDTEEFPSACGDWALERGCTRIVMEKDGCVDASNLSTLSTLYDTTFERVNNAISKCVDKK